MADLSDMVIVLLTKEQVAAGLGASDAERQEFENLMTSMLQTDLDLYDEDIIEADKEVMARAQAKWFFGHVTLTNLAGVEINVGPQDYEDYFSIHLRGEGVGIWTILSKLVEAGTAADVEIVSGAASRRTQRRGLGMRTDDGADDSWWTLQQAMAWHAARGREQLAPICGL